MAVAASETPTHQCGYDGQTWHDRLLTLEDDLRVVLELVESICGDYEVDFISPADDLLIFVSKHDWRDRVTVTEFARQIAGNAEYVMDLRRKTGFYETASAASGL